MCHHKTVHSIVNKLNVVVSPLQPILFKFCNNHRMLRSVTSTKPQLPPFLLQMVNLPYALSLPPPFILLAQRPPLHSFNPIFSFSFPTEDFSGLSIQVSTISQISETYTFWTPVIVVYESVNLIVIILRNILHFVYFLHELLASCYKYYRILSSFKTMSSVIRKVFKQYSDNLVLFIFIVTPSHWGYISIF